jgi:hypothetical protein
MSNSVYNSDGVLNDYTQLLINEGEDIFTKPALNYLNKVYKAIDKAFNYYRATEKVKDWKNFLVSEDKDRFCA